MKEIVKTIKENQLIRVIIELIILTLVFNISKVIGVIFTLVILLEIILSKKDENLLFIFLFLSFFDEVLVIDIIKGSISRIIMVVIFIKLLIHTIKNRIKPNKCQLSIIGFFLFSIIIGLVTVGFKLESFITLFNILIFVYFSMVLKFNNIDDINKFIEKLCLIIVIAVLNSILYGVINNNYLKELLENSVIYRFKGTYEPNFMCMYINLGILSLLTIKNKFFSKKLYYVFLAIMINAVIATVSMTGIITLTLSILLYLFFNRKNLKKEIIDLIIVVIFTVTIFMGNKLLNISKEQKDEQTVKNYEIIQEVNPKYTNNHNEIKIESKENNVTVSIAENKEKTEIEDKEKNETKKEAPNQNESELSKRLEEMKSALINGELGKFTSGRIPIGITFIEESFKRPILNILFGNDMTVKKLYCNFFMREVYSHNSYIDCLYNFGVIGFLIIISFIWYRTIKNIYMGISIKGSKYSNNIKIIRIMLLTYALALSLYTKRMFLIFFLL